MEIAAVATIEQESVRHELAYLDVPALEQLRQNHKNEISTARTSALNSIGYDSLLNPLDAANAANEAEQQVLDTLDEKYQNYLDGFIDKEELPDLYDRMLAIINKSSLAHTADEEWYRGQKGPDGEFDPTTSGIYKLESELDALCSELADGMNNLPGDEEDEETDNNPSPEQTVYDEAILKLAEKRKDLARWGVSRSTQMRKKGDRAKETMRFYKKAEEDYRKAYTAAGEAAIALLQSQGKSEDEIRKSVAIGTVNEAIAETAAVKEVLDSDTSRKAKIARWLGRPRNMVISNIIGGSTIGFGIGKVLKGATAVVAAPLAPALLGFGIAAKTSKGVLQASIGNRASLYSMHDKRSQEDLKAVHANAMTLLGLTGASAPEIDNLAERSATQLTRTYEHRAESNRKYNQNRAVRAAVISGAAAVAAAAAAEYIFDHKSGVGSRPSRPGTGQVDNPSGGRPSVGEINQPSGTGNVISPERAEFLKYWDGMSRPQQIDFLRMMDWQQTYIEQNGLMNDPEKYQKSVKAFVKGVKYMGKLEAARRAA